MTDDPHGVAEWGTATMPFQLQGKPPLVHVPGRNYSRDRVREYAGDHEGFYGWMCVVDHRIQRKTGLGVLDFPDRCWRDEYEDRVPPGEAADVAIDEYAAEFGV